MSDINPHVVTRMAPSPTGPFHIGGMRTLLFNYLFARHHGGRFILRVEDTDKERSKKEFENDILESMKWMGLEYDGFFRQSDPQRVALHKKYLQKMIDDGFAYISEEIPTAEDIERAQKYGKELNKTVIRFKNPNKVVTFQDLIRGEVSVDTTDLGDFIVAKDVEHPLYHVGVVIDDYDTGVTHVIRAAEHIANTPRQILMIEALGAPVPTYAHVPFILASDGKRKLSKRFDNVAVLNYRDLGYLPEALLNYLVLIGWNPGTEQEFFTKEELVKEFSLEKVQKAGGAFNVEKLNWFNRHYVRQLSHDAQANAMRPYVKDIEGFSEARFMSIVPLLVERINVWSDMNKLIAEGDVQYFFIDPIYEAAGLVWKKSTPDSTLKHLKYVYELLQTYSGDWTVEALQPILMPYAEEMGKGDVLWPVRYALSGRDKSPDPFTLLSIFGKDESLHRIAIAIGKLSS